MTDDFIIIEGEITAARHKTGMLFFYTVYIPKELTGEAALIVDHDGINKENCAALLTLAREGKAPYTVGIGISPAVLRMKDGTVRFLRMNSYDLFDREYGDFIVDELIPHTASEYGITFSSDPGKHIVSGASSGGVSAMTVAWFHPDYFRRVYLSSPSFLAMGRGCDLPYLIRKHETKPLRVYMEWSENEPNDYFGSSFAVACDADKAFRFAGYDYRGKYFPGESHISRYHDESEAYSRFAWLLDARETEYSYSPRVREVIPFGETWERCTAFPKMRTVVRDGYDTAVMSADHNMIYAANRDSAEVYSFAVGTGNRYVHYYLHTLPGKKAAVLSLAVDEQDRLYVLTGDDIQCVRTFGLSDAILDLPGGANPTAIAFGEEDRNMLYLKTEDGIYRRRMLVPGATDAKTKRKHIDYYD